MVLKTLDVFGPLCGYGIAKRIEQNPWRFAFCQPGHAVQVLLRLEQEEAIESSWGVSENPVALPARYRDSHETRCDVG